MGLSNSASAGRDSDLRHLSGLLVLVGAGKMGGALLEGWLQLDLDPRQVAVLEPQPSPHISELAARGMRLNPAMQTIADAAAVVIAVKPQVAAQIVPNLTR